VPDHIVADIKAPQEQVQALYTGGNALFGNGHGTPGSTGEITSILRYGEGAVKHLPGWRWRELCPNSGPAAIFLKKFLAFWFNFLLII